jgi:hypothetical protein
MFVQCLIFAVAGLALIYALFWINKRESGGRLIFTPLLLFGVHEVIFVWPAALFARVNGVSEDNYASIVILSATLAFIVGYVLFCGDARRSASTAVDFWSRPLRRPDDQAHLRAIILCTILFVLLGFYFYQGLPPAVTGLNEFLHHGYASGVNERLAEQRLELTKGHFFGGEYRGQGAIRALFRVGWPYLTIIATVLYLRRRQTAWRLITLGLLVASYVYIGGDGTRGPLLWAFISVLVAVSYYAHLRLRTLTWFGATLVVALVVLSLPQKLGNVAAVGGSWRDGARTLAERILIGNGINSVYVIEYVRSGCLDLRWGGIHRSDLGAALPFANSGVPFTYELFLLQNPEARTTCTTLSSMTCLGCFYGDFGWPGTVIGYFSLGAVTAVAGRLLFKRQKTVANVAFVGMMAMDLGQLNLHGIVYCSVWFAVLLFVAKLYEFCFILASSRRLFHEHSVRHPAMSRQASLVIGGRDCRKA